MPEQYIFTIENLTKAYNKREVLKNIWLAFYPGAKIGVIGSNGAGKSTLLRVMALQEKDFVGSARPADGIRIGFVPQEPRLDETKDVRGNVEEAVAPLPPFSPDSGAGGIGAGPRAPRCRGRDTLPSWRDKKQRRRAGEERGGPARRKALARELEWARMAPRARVTKSKARLSQYE